MMLPTSQIDEFIAFAEVSFGVEVLRHEKVTDEHARFMWNDEKLVVIRKLSYDPQREHGVNVQVWCSDVDVREEIERMWTVYCLATSEEKENDESLEE